MAPHRIVFQQITANRHPRKRAFDKVDILKLANRNDLAKKLVTNLAENAVVML